MDISVYPGLDLRFSLFGVDGETQTERVETIMTQTPGMFYHEQRTKLARALDDFFNATDKMIFEKEQKARQEFALGLQEDRPEGFGGPHGRGPDLYSSVRTAEARHDESRSVADDIY